MIQTQERQNGSVRKRQQDWAKLIRKLRWIGMEEEACRLETAVSSLPPDERGTVSAGPFSTD